MERRGFGGDLGGGTSSGRRTLGVWGRSVQPPEAGSPEIRLQHWAIFAIFK